MFALAADMFGLAAKPRFGLAIESCLFLPGKMFGLRLTMFILAADMFGLAVVRNYTWNILGISLASARITSPCVTLRTWNTWTRVTEH